MTQPAGEGFSRSCRLTRAEEYRNVFQSNVRMGDDSMTFLVSKQASTRPRLGFAIARKQIKRAVDRNRLKRLARESFRKQQKQLPNRDVVVMVRSKILTLTSAQVTSRFNRHWQKVIDRCADC